uniref:Nucleic-acid-binding protein from transposon X-element n=1 Tax=Bactrocera dorsalis TaxID=27457 RepID=A0A034VDC4_BACDO
MFIVCFEPTENIKKIYEIKHILNSNVKLEPIKPSNLVPQCKSCQAFGHTRNYCYKPPRCIKCAGNHSTLSCTKPAELPPKCCNCSQNHPANYRGCEVTKQLQKIKNATGKNNEHKYEPKRLSPTTSTVPQKEDTTVNHQSGKPSFASITKGAHKAQQHLSENQTNTYATGDITGNFSLILNTLNKLEEQNSLTHERVTKLERKNETDENYDLECKRLAQTQ